MRMPRAIPVNTGTRLKVVRFDPNFQTAFVCAAAPTDVNPVIDRRLLATGTLVGYMWPSQEYFWVEHDDGTKAVYSHSEVLFMDNRVFLPDCKECGCFAVSHVPVQSTKLRIKCLACRNCEGYVHPTESCCSSIEPNVYYDHERGHFEPLEPEEDTRE